MIRLYPIRERKVLRRPADDIAFQQTTFTIQSMRAVKPFRSALSEFHFKGGKCSALFDKQVDLIAPNADILQSHCKNVEKNRILKFRHGHLRQW